MSVYDDIAARLDAEQSSIEAEVAGFVRERDAANAAADQAHEEALAAADRVFNEGVRPLGERAREVETFRGYLTAMQNPQQPSATGSATTSAPDEQPAPVSEQPEPATPSDEPSTPSEQPEPTPSTESGDASPAPKPTASPEPITVENLGAAENIDVNLPVEVPLTTGQITVVPAGDVLAARDASIADEALTTQQLELRRNSDWP